MEFFAHSFDPEVSEQGILDELPVMCNCFLRDRVHNAVAEFFNFDDRSCVLIMG
jgi:hypothetical protein